MRVWPAGATEPGSGTTVHEGEGNVPFKDQIIGVSDVREVYTFN